VLSKEYLPFQESYQRGDPRLEKRNDTLLVVANLGYHPRKSYRGFDSLATLVLHQFMSAMRSHSLFQQYGHVRVMVWASDEERRHLLPREIHQRRKTSVEAELSCEHISEIASSTQEIGRFRRAKFLDMEKGREVLRKMEVAGIRTPKGRESVVLNELLQEGEGDKFPREDDPASVYMFSEELERLEAAFAAGEFNTYEDEAATQSSSIPRRGPLSKVTLTPEFKRLRYLRYRKTSKDKKEDRWSALAEQFDSIIALQKDIHFAKASGADTHAQELELQQRTQFWQDDIVDKLPDQEMAQLLYLLDNRRTYSNNPPLLVWDRRNFEPLRVRPEEFFPHKEMCLLDFHPRSLWPILRKDLRNNYDILEFILSSIFILPTQPIKRALSSLWPGAYEWIVAECPSLTDPSKGGTLDLDMMTVRCMTEDMLKEIVEAWVRWPFRPTRYELLSRMGSTAHNADELDISE
jgi:mitochondrial transcription factor 1